MLVFLAIGITSCQKETERDNASSTQESSEAIKENVQAIKARFPKLEILKDGKNLRFVDNNGISYVNSGEGFSFSGNQGPTFASGGSITFKESANGSTVYLDLEKALSGGGSGGTVQAGSTTLTINEALCFADGEDDLGILGGDFEFNNVSIIYGISGDFEAMSNATSDEEVFDKINGIAIYYVISKNVEGTFNVIDLEAFNDPDVSEGVGFAIVADFKDGNVYFSKSGTLSVSGGSMTFSGEYYSFNGNIVDGEIDDANYSVVSGIGTMGCN